MKKDNFFYKDGEYRWRTLLLWFSLLTLVGIFALGPEIGTSFAERFWRSGIFQILGPVAGIAVWLKTKKVYDEKQDATGLWKGLALGVVLFWGGLFGPNVGFKEDRKASIPDNPVYYFNGKVQNATDSTKKNYYFNEFKLNAEDSTYVVQYGEEPGYNWNWRSVVGDEEGKSPKSTAPRANEEWERPVTRNAQKFVDGKRE